MRSKNRIISEVLHINIQLIFFLYIIVLVVFILHLFTQLILLCHNSGEGFVNIYDFNEVFFTETQCDYLQNNLTFPEKIK